MSLKLAQKIGLCAAATALLLGGCGGIDGVQLNGKVFDAVGIGSGSSSSDAVPKMAVRQPLVVPPTTEALPQPGSGKPQQPSLADIQDPDRIKKTNQASLDAQQAEYCKKNYEEPMARGDTSAESAAGPLGSCHPSVFTALTKWTTPAPKKGDGEDDDTQ